MKHRIISMVDQTHGYIGVVREKAAQIRADGRPIQAGEFAETIESAAGAIEELLKVIESYEREITGMEGIK